MNSNTPDHVAACVLAGTPTFDRVRIFCYQPDNLTVEIALFLWRMFEGPFQRNATDEAAARWLREAKSGDARAKERLMRWVYEEASDYYLTKARSKERLSLVDAQELISQFLLDFQSLWIHVENVSNYTRRSLSRNLRRFLARRKHDAVRLDELCDAELAAVAVEIEEKPWMSWSDHGWSVYQAVLIEYFESAPETMLIVESRLDQVAYAQIASRMGISEGAARMRVSRFMQRVRRRLAVPAPRGNGLGHSPGSRHEK